MPLTLISGPDAGNLCQNYYEFVWSDSSIKENPCLEL